MKSLILQIPKDVTGGSVSIKETVLNGISSLVSFSSSSDESYNSGASTGGAGVEGGFRSVLSVSTKSRHDSTVFHCLASNVYGNDTKKINLLVQGKWHQLRHFLTLITLISG